MASSQPFVIMLREMINAIAEDFSKEELRQFVRDYYPDLLIEVDFSGSDRKIASNLIDILHHFDKLNDVFCRHLIEERPDFFRKRPLLWEKNLTSPKELLERLTALRNGLKKLRGRSPSVLRISDLDRIQRALSHGRSKPLLGGCALLAAWIQYTYQSSHNDYPANLRVDSVDGFLSAAQEATQEEIDYIVKGAPHARAWLDTHGFRLKDDDGKK